VLEAERLLASIAAAETSRTRDAAASGFTALAADGSVSGAATVIELVALDSESVDGTLLGEGERSGLLCLNDRVSVGVVCDPHLSVAAYWS
jgi:hypothetical protein